MYHPNEGENEILRGLNSGLGHVPVEHHAFYSANIKEQTYTPGGGRSSDLTRG